VTINGRLMLVPEAGHSSCREPSRIFNRAILDCTGDEVKSR
jgi:hypothetical protein